MSQHQKSHGSSSGHTKAMNSQPSGSDDAVIIIPPFDNSAILARFKLSLVGRMFHQNGRSMEALLAFMPRAHIWDVEGRARGLDLGNGRFQFDFESEADLQKVLKKRPCHFNKWSFALEKWTQNFPVEFPNTIDFWIRVSGIPTYYWCDGVFRSIGNVLGVVREVDERTAIMQVSINVDRPLQFERKAQFPNGEVLPVTLIYDKLHRYCFTCKRICHEERTYPDLTEAERKEKLAAREVARGDQSPLEDLGSYRSRSPPRRQNLTSEKNRTASKEGEIVQFRGSVDGLEDGIDSDSQWTVSETLRNIERAPRTHASPLHQRTQKTQRNPRKKSLNFDQHEEGTWETLTDFSLGLVQNHGEGSSKTRSENPLEMVRIADDISPINGLSAIEEEDLWPIEEEHTAIGNSIFKEAVVFTGEEEKEFWEDLEVLEFDAEIEEALKDADAPMDGKDDVGGRTLRR